MGPETTKQVSGGLEKVLFIMDHLQQEPIFERMSGV